MYLFPLPPATKSMADIIMTFFFLFLFSSPAHRYRPEQGIALPLSQVRVRLHRHQQSGGSPAPTPEAWLYHGRGLWEVHPSAGVRPTRWLCALRQADTLPLLELPVRRARSVSDDGPQVPSHGMMHQCTIDGYRSAHASLSLSLSLYYVYISSYIDIYINITIILLCTRVDVDSIISIVNGKGDNANKSLLKKYCYNIGTYLLYEMDIIW